MPLKWSPHVALRVPTRAQIEALIAAHGREEAGRRVAAIHAQREQAIALEKTDPLRHALFTPESFRRSSELMREVDELLVSGGNREGKTWWAVKHAVEDLVFNEGRVWAFFHTTERSSINQQQGKIHAMLPPEWRSLGKEGESIYVKFTEAAGFGGHQMFILPNKSKGMFFNYAQKPSVLEGYELDGVWFDELVPLEFIEAMEYRLGQGRRLQILVTFTPVTGYTPTVARYISDGVVTETRPAPLLRPDVVHVPGCPKGHMPYVMRCRTRKAAVVFYHNGMNPYGAGKEVADKAAAKRPAEIKIRAYGWAEKGTGQAFPRFDPSVHTLPRERFDAIARKGGTRYCVADPGDAKNWFIKWYFVTPQGWTILYREWPDQPTYGNWAEPPLIADRVEWRPGEAQRREAGKGIAEYKDIIRHLEGALWLPKEGRWDESRAETITRRLIDPRLGGTAVPSQEQGTSIIDLMATPLADGAGKPRWPAMYWDEAPACGVFEGVQLINAALAWDTEQPLSAINCPKWYVVDDLLQSLRCYSDYSAREEGTYSQRDALKDIIDPDRYFAKSGYGYMEPTLLTSRGGTYY